MSRRSFSEGGLTTFDSSGQNPGSEFLLRCRQQRRPVAKGTRGGAVGGDGTGIGQPRLEPWPVLGQKSAKTVVWGAAREGPGLARTRVYVKKRFFANALPDPDLK